MPDGRPGTTPFGPGSRVTVGRSKRVHEIRSGTVYTMRGFGTTYCGYHGNPTHGWMRVTDEETTCRACIKRGGKG